MTQAVAVAVAVYFLALHRLRPDHRSRSQWALVVQDQIAVRRLQAETPFSAQSQQRAADVVVLAVCQAPTQ
jgi:hypothetical protein